MTEKKIITIWPQGSGQSAWRQLQRWMVLDVTAGIDQAIVLARGPRSDMLDECMRLRSVNAMNREIEPFVFGVRSRKAMDRLGVTTLGQLAKHTAEELLAIKGFGHTSLLEVQERLGSVGLSLKTKESNVVKPQKADA